MESVLKIFIFIVFSNSLIVFTYGADREKVLCGDEDCKKIIEMGVTNIRQNPLEKWKVSFEPKKTVSILAKYYNTENHDKNPQMYKISVGGRVGWAPATSIKVEKVKEKDLIEAAIPEEIQSNRNKRSTNTPMTSMKEAANLKSSETSNQPDEVDVVSEKTPPLPVNIPKSSTANEELSLQESTKVEKTLVTPVLKANSSENTLQENHSSAEEASITSASKESDASVIASASKIENKSFETENSHVNVKNKLENNPNLDKANVDNSTEVFPKEVKAVSENQNTTELNETELKYNASLLQNTTTTDTEEMTKKEPSVDDLEQSTQNNKNILVNDTSQSDSIQITSSEPSTNVNVEGENIFTENGISQSDSIQITSSEPSTNVNVESENVNKTSEFEVHNATLIQENSNLTLQNASMVEKEGEQYHQNEKSKEDLKEVIDNDTTNTKVNFNTNQNSEILPQKKEDNIQSENLINDVPVNEINKTLENKNNVLTTEENDDEKSGKQGNISEESLKHENIVKKSLEQDVSTEKSEENNDVSQEILTNVSTEQNDSNGNSSVNDVPSNKDILNQESFLNNENFEQQSTSEDEPNKEALNSPSAELNKEEQNIFTTDNPIEDNNILDVSTETTTTSLPKITADDLPTTTSNFDADASNNVEEQITEHTESTIESKNEEDISIFTSIQNMIFSFWPTDSEQKEKQSELSEEQKDDEIYRISNLDSNPKIDKEVDNGFCEKLDPNSCPTLTSSSKKSINDDFYNHNHHKSKNLNSKIEKCHSENDFFSSLSDKILEMVDLLVCLTITACTTLIFAFGYYCICHNRRENTLLSKLNIVERSLLASCKESMVLKHELLETHHKLKSIEDNSFGSNDMVIALKKELEIREEEKNKLQEQVTSLEKELENAAEAGLELNRIISELLSNQSSDDSIINSVEELQKQLNEQQNTILQINATLAEKSRENSELQLIITNQVNNYQAEIDSLKQKNQNLESENNLLHQQIEDIQKQYSDQLTKLNEQNTFEISKLNDELASIRSKYNEVNRKLQESQAKTQTLEEFLKSIKQDSKIDIRNLLDAANLKAEMLVLNRERDLLKEHLEAETDARKLLESQLKVISQEVTQLKQEHSKAEKEKLEAQTRLEVLSNYFKEKETQLQKELSVKEAMWLKQQGETTSTVERVRAMQDEIQSLKSQNDSLRAEIEAQNAAYKAQISSLENRTHETWLAARHSERKYEEARSEASALRRKLTLMGANPNITPNDSSLYNRGQNSIDNSMSANDATINNTSSPIHMEPHDSPLTLHPPPPPPPPFLPLPFMTSIHPPPHGHQHPFMPMPPPLIPPGEIRLAPLGRLKSPPPMLPQQRRRKSYSPSILDNDDDEDYDDYEDDEERYPSLRNSRYSPEHGGRYSPDNKYNYNTDLMSGYDTETDFSLPPSPQARSDDRVLYNSRSRDHDSSGSRQREREREQEKLPRNFKAYSPSPPPSLTNSERNKKSKGALSSGSADSYDSRKNKGKKSKV